MNKEFNKWVYLVCESKSKSLRNLKEPHDIFPYINLSDAKLAFLDGQTPKEYSKEIIIF